MVWTCVGDGGWSCVEEAVEFIFRSMVWTCVGDGGWSCVEESSGVHF